MTVAQAMEGKEYYIRQIKTNDVELDAFLFTLGCYDDQPITVISRRRSGHIVAVKDGRYNIDNGLAKAICLYD